MGLVHPRHPATVLRGFVGPEYQDRVDHSDFRCATAVGKLDIPGCWPGITEPVWRLSIRPSRLFRKGWLVGRCGACTQGRGRLDDQSLPVQARCRLWRRRRNVAGPGSGGLVFSLLKDAGAESSSDIALRICPVPAGRNDSPLE